MSILVKAFKKKCVWFDKLNFMNGDIAYTNKHVMVLRGEAHEVIHCALERKPSGFSRKKFRQSNLCRVALIFTSAPQYIWSFTHNLNCC